MEESQKALAKQVDEVLMPNQRDRLKQITVQAQGTGALSDEEVAKELGLSDDQEKQIQQVRQEAAEKMRENFRPGAGGDGDREARREQFQKAQKETDDKVLAVLTSEQRDKFEKMKGEKYEDVSELRFGGFGGFGGPGGGRGQRRGGGNNN
jgi:hypothetical protein